MSKKIIIGIVLVGLLVIAGGAAYILRPPADASAPIEAVPVEVDQSAAQTPPDAPEAPANEPAPVEDQAEMPANDEPTEAANATTSTGLSIFTIVQAESEVRFILDELLSGVPTTVVGVTDQVAGEIAIDPAAPANAKVGAILINARTFVTDSDFRNRAINNQILQTGEFEFIQFTPTTITGFPENPVLGEALEFQITGDLTIRDITHEVTFDVTVTAVSETQLEGHAEAMIARADYDLQIPEVPRVADVDEEVLLEIDFVAVAK